MKRPLLLLLPLLLAGCGKKNPAPASQPLPVTVAQPAKREVTVYREFPSTLAGFQEVEIRARVKGVLSLATGLEGFDPDFAGNVVREGQPLFIIEPEPYAQATRAAEAAVAQAEATRDLAEKRYDRVRRAGSSRAVSELDVEIAAAELAQATAAVSQASANLEEAKISQGYTIIRAPVTGRISRLLIDPGNLVGAGDSTLLATLIDDSKILAYFEVPERPLIRYFGLRSEKEGETSPYEAEIRLKLADGSIYGKTGRIDYLENQVDPATRTAKVRAVFDNPDAQLSSGLYGLVGYPGGPDPDNPKAREALLLPSVAILRDLEGDFVWVVDENNVVIRRKVTTGEAVEAPGPAAAMQTVILTGLDGSENVIVSGLQRARAGATVAPQQAGN
jgi:RND family efflux transporter MFP subunit